MLLSSSKFQDFEKFIFCLNWSTRGGWSTRGNPTLLGGLRSLHFADSRAWQALRAHWTFSRIAPPKLATSTFPGDTVSLLGIRETDMYSGFLPYIFSFFLQFLAHLLHFLLVPIYSYTSARKHSKAPYAYNCGR